MGSPARPQPFRPHPVLDLAPDAEFDALVAATALVCEVPVAIVSLIDSDRQRVKASVGLPRVMDAPRELALCAHVVEQSEVFEVADVTLDDRCRVHSTITGDPGFRFYAGAPLQLSTGEVVGTLCVSDAVPRRLTESQRAILVKIAFSIASALESRVTARAFRASEARFRALTEASPLGVFETDADGLCTYTNERWQAMYGMSGDSALGWGWSRTLHPDDRESVIAEWQRTSAARIDFDMEFRIRRDDGSVRYVRSMSRPVLDDAGEVTSHVGSVKDITERKAYEMQLRRSQQLLGRTGELAEVGGWELDLATGTLEWSEHTRRIHGVASDYEPSLDTAISFYAPEARPVIQEAVERSMVDGSPWDLELPFIQASGDRIWVRAVGCAELSDGAPVRLVGAFQNITQRVEHRRALEAARDRMTLAADSGGIGFWDFDVASGQLHWDAWVYRLYGLPESSTAVSYNQWARLLHPDDRRRVQQQLSEAMTTHCELRTEFRVVWSDGSVHHLGAAGRITRDEGGSWLRMVGVNWDITPMRQLTAELSDQHELLRVTLQSIGDAVITTDATGLVTWLNPVAERMTGWSSEEATGQPVSHVFRVWQSDSPDVTGNPVEKCLRENAPCSFGQHTTLASRAGTEFGIEESTAPINTVEGALLGAVLVFRDVTEQRRATGEMRHRAMHDALTGLVNRAEFDSRLRRTWQASGNDQRSNALLFIDLDDFKLVNDACGHFTGDALLQQVAEMLSSTVRASDTVARLGGDEFAVLLTDCNIEQAHRVAQQICERMQTFGFVRDGRRFQIGASIGLVPIDGRWFALEDATEAADASCYAAKNAGRNRVHVWSEDDLVSEQRHRDRDWVTRLEAALTGDHFVLHAQRIDAITSASCGMRAEVLIRLRGADGQLIPPGAFLPTAERVNLSSRIDAWVLDRVIRSLRALPDISRVDTLSVNLAGQSVGDRTFQRDMLELLTAAGPEICARLCLDIPELAVITNLTEVAPFIADVRTLGVRVALDDFGAIASSFNYLKSITVDQLNIDGQCIRQLVSDPLAAAAVRCFVDVATTLGAQTVAKFGDLPEVLGQARALGIDFAQGFGLHTPVPLEESLDQVVRAAAGRAEPHPESIAVC